MGLAIAAQLLQRLAGTGHVGVSHRDMGELLPTSGASGAPGGERELVRANWTWGAGPFARPQNGDTLDGTLWASFVENRTSPCKLGTCTRTCRGKTSVLPPTAGWQPTRLGSSHE